VERPKEAADEGGGRTKGTEWRTCERGGPPRRDVGAAEHHASDQERNFTNVKLTDEYFGSKKAKLPRYYLTEGTKNQQSTLHMYSN